MRDFWTAAEISESTGLPIGTVYRLAHADQWRRTRTKPRGYRRVDVLATLARRNLTTQGHVKKDRE